MKLFIITGLLIFFLFIPLFGLESQQDIGNFDLSKSPKEVFFHYLHNWDGEHYQQTELLYEDPRGDAVLINKLNTVPMKLINALTKKDYRKEDIEKEEELKNSDDFIIGKKNPINPKALVNKFVEIIRNHPEIIPESGIEHKWSSPAKRYMWYGFYERAKRFAQGKTKDIPTPLLMRTKTFLCLACGFTSRYTVTGKEQELEDYIINNFEDRSVQISDALEASYIINKGNIYLTLLTLENMLAKDPYKENRGDSPLQKKLFYIRNDSKAEGDNYGAWYHFFGIAFYGYLRNPITTRFVAEVESLGSIFLEGFDKQEDYINRYGSKFGSLLRKMVKERWWENENIDISDTDYMTNDEFDHSKEYTKPDSFLTKMKKKVRKIFGKDKSTDVAQLSQENGKFTIDRLRNQFSSFKSSVATIEKPRKFSFAKFKNILPKKEELRKKRYGFINTLKEVSKNPSMLLKPSEISNQYRNEMKDYEIVSEFSKKETEFNQKLEHLENTLKTINELEKNPMTLENEEQLRNVREEFIKTAENLELTREEFEELTIVMDPELQVEIVDKKWFAQLYEETFLEEIKETTKTTVKETINTIDENKQLIMKLYQEELTKGNLKKAEELLKQINK